MQKVITFLSSIFIMVWASSCIQASGKTFFAPQPLSSMIGFLPMETKKASPQEKIAPTYTSPLLSSLAPYALQDFGLSDRFAPEKNPQLLFAYNDRAKKKKSTSSWSPEGSSSQQEAILPRRTTSSPTSDATTSHPLSLPILQQQPHDAHTWTFDVTPFYMKSFNSADLRRYFFPTGKDALVIQGSQAGNGPDISGTWLKIVGTNAAAADQALISNAFQSTLRISPTYEYVGTHLKTHKQIGTWWTDIALPIAQLTVNHGMSEDVSGNVSQIESITTFNSNVIIPPPTPPRRAYFENATPLYSVDAATALSQSAWQYHKLSKSPLKHIGIGDTTVRIGFTKKEFQFFARLTLPTSKTPSNAFMFEPQLGNGSHLGLGIGGAWDHTTQFATLNTLAIHAQIDGSYLFSNDQMRTYDIASYGPLSRYLVFRVVQQGVGQPPWYSGVNVLTKKTTVSPQGELNAGLSGMLARGNFRFGMSYGFYAAPQEKLRINDTFAQAYGVAHMIGTGATAANVSFINNPRISTHGDSGAAIAAVPDKIINIADLDIPSATQPAKASSQFALSCGLHKKIAGDDFGIHLMSGITINHTQAALSTWLIALQCTIKL